MAKLKDQIESVYKMLMHETNMALSSVSHVLIKCAGHMSCARCICTTSTCYKETPKNLKGRKTSSQKWLARQINDPFVKKAKENHYRCRSAYKLLELDDKYNILRPGYTVVDCGAAPGSWSQVAVERVRAKHGNTETGDSPLNGQVVSVDLQHIEPIPGVTRIPLSDFTMPRTQRLIMESLRGQHADVVLSDMAPRSTGLGSLDHDIIIELCVSVLKFSTEVLAKDGAVVLKILMGSDEKKLTTVMERMFKNVRSFKPDSSRSDSAELFLVGTGYFLRKM